MFWPMFTLVCWTFLVLLRIGYKRLHAAFSGRVQAEDFRLGEADCVPEDVRLANRNYMNLLELPVLFYAAALLCIAMPLGNPLLLPLAWLYVALRIAHSLIHLGYNHVLHRFAAFASSNCVLLALWLVIGWEMTGR